MKTRETILLICRRLVCRIRLILIFLNNSLNNSNKEIIQIITFNKENVVRILI